MSYFATYLRLLRHFIVSFISFCLFAFTGVLTTGAQGLDYSHNFIVETVVRVPGMTDTSVVNALGVDAAIRKVMYYDALGRKLRTSCFESDGTTSVTDYVSNRVYENGILKYILIDGGNIEGGQYRFYLKDHLGSNRVVASADGNILQSVHYYPYGLPFGEGHSSSSQPYLFNGKEDLGGTGLTFLDYGARHFGTTLPVWMTPDPLAEKYYSVSPYSYCNGNPLKFIDPDGRIPVDVVWDVLNVVYDVGAAIYNHFAGDHETAKSYWTDAGVDLVSAFVPYVPAGASKAGKLSIKAVEGIDNVSDARRGMKNADAIAEGLQFEREELAKAVARGETVKPHLCLVPLNGKGNIKGNRTFVDQLRLNDDKTFSIVETKRSSSTKLSKGQEAAQEHVKSINKMFELRSDWSEIDMKPGQTIYVVEFERVDKYK